MQTVGQLDEDDADVASHGEQHLAEIFRLLLFLGFELDLANLAHAIDELSNLLTEIVGDLLLGGLGIFYYVVENGGGDRLRIQTHARKYARNLQRVMDIWLAATPQLTFVRLRTEEVGAMDIGNLIRLEIAFEPVAEIAD